MLVTCQRLPSGQLSLSKRDKGVPCHSSNVDMRRSAGRSIVFSAWHTIFSRCGGCELDSCTGTAVSRDHSCLGLFAFNVENEGGATGGDIFEHCLLQATFQLETCRIVLGEIVCG